MDFVQKNIQREKAKVEKRRFKLQEEIRQIDEYVQTLNEVEKRNAQSQADSNEEVQKDVHQDSSKGKK